MRYYERRVMGHTTVVRPDFLSSSSFSLAQKLAGLTCVPMVWWGTDEARSNLLSANFPQLVLLLLRSLLSKTSTLEVDLKEANGAFRLVKTALGALMNVSMDHGAYPRPPLFEVSLCQLHIVQKS